MRHTPRENTLPILLMVTRLATLMAMPKAYLPMDFQMGYLTVTQKAIHLENRWATHSGSLMDLLKVFLPTGNHLDFLKETQKGYHWAIRLGYRLAILMGMRMEFLQTENHWAKRMVCLHLGLLTDCRKANHLDCSMGMRMASPRSDFPMDYLMDLQMASLQMVTLTGYQKGLPMEFPLTGCQTETPKVKRLGCPPMVSHWAIRWAMLTGCLR